ncbi:MAG: DUF1428 domain-containing protein [Deltaproteobacteria bacterium]|nr:DUF1428 domain-containing protein [Deltaproteobacteria bacterium]
MSAYIDGFVIPVPKDRLEEYKKLATLSCKVWLEHGALEYTESIAEDVKPGERTSFPQSVDLQEGETVIFSFIKYKDRAHRDEVNAKAMADPRLQDITPANLPFDGKRLIWGGFETLITSTP